MDKEYFIEKYKALKQFKEDKKPLRDEFLKFCKVDERFLVKAFGNEPYSRLQEACGDKPNQLQLERANLSDILNNYGFLTREIQRIPVTNDWIFKGFSPAPDGLRKVHNLSFKTLPEIFVEK